MGNEISTVGGAVATAATGVAAGVTFGQVEALNKATEDCAKFTGKKFMDTNVRHVGELAGVSIAAAATLGQCEAVNECVRKAAPACGKTLVKTASDIADGTPGVGHVKGAVHYACGDKDGGDAAMKASSRTVGVIGGGVAGFAVGGPVGAAMGGVAGGGAMDGITTGVDSAVHGEYKPAGQVAAWTKAVTSKTAHDSIEGIVGIVTAPAGDALAGYAAGKAVLDRPKASTTEAPAGPAEAPRPPAQGPAARRSYPGADLTDMPALKRTRTTPDPQGSGTVLCADLPEPRGQLVNSDTGASRVVSKIVHEKVDGVYPTTKAASKHCQRLDVSHARPPTAHGPIKGAHVHEYATAVHSAPDGSMYITRPESVRAATPHDFRWPVDTSIPPSRHSELSHYPSS